MCGIAGFTQANRRADRGLVWRLTEQLRHRGPDQQSVWVSDQVSLAAVRLKIIDLAGGEQPMTSEDGDTVLVYNGEVYNYREIRRTLEERGHRFHSQSDTEVVLRSFLEWDVHCFERLKGMFGAAVWQQSRRRLVLARDRLGIKPLYYARRGGQIYFGSELKALLIHPEISRTLDLDAVWQYLSLNYIPGPRTGVEGVEKLAPGHYLEWRDGRVEVRAFWKLEFEPQDRMDEEEAKQELDHLLRQSIREHLVSDVPLGVLLSGGIDSSTIVHYAACESSSRLKTFSISFAGRSFDESPYFRKVAEQYGTEHHEFDLARDLDLQQTIRRFADYADEPCGDSSSLPVWYLSKMCREHVTVTLSGEGADELFGGYLTYQADRLRRLALRAPAALRGLALAAARRFLPVSEDKISVEYMVKRFLEGVGLPELEAHCYWNGAFSESQKRDLCALAAEAPVEVPPRLGRLNRFLWYDQRYYLPDDILAKVDRMSMAHSLEVRPPFLDHQVVEFAARLPERFKIRGRQQKYLLKRLMRDRLPSAVLRRKKVGFDIPAHDWLRRELKPLLLEALNPAALGRLGLFREGAVERLVEDHLERRANLGFHLWGLMILLLWIERWQLQSPLQRVEQAVPTPTLIP